ncbi:hypothetical protein K439DRAFT_1620329 [Ramaria rubella]|nr:hypothetical protein K439DRAFT_1620329 [Ramaria rubella]
MTTLTPPTPPADTYFSKSSGRGGSGNVRRVSDLNPNSIAEDEIFHKKRQESKLNPRVMVNYLGRGGAGNILAASDSKSTRFDISADPDDEYEQIIVEKTQRDKRDKPCSTGRGGLGNRPRAKSADGDVAASLKGKKAKGYPRMRASTSSSSVYSPSLSSSEYREREINIGRESLQPPTPGLLHTPWSPDSPSPSSPTSGSFPSPLPPTPTLLVDSARIQSDYQRSLTLTRLERGRESIRLRIVPVKDVSKRKKWWRLSRRPKTRDLEEAHVHDAAAPGFDSRLHEAIGRLQELGLHDLETRESLHAEDEMLQVSNSSAEEATHLQDDEVAEVEWVEERDDVRSLSPVSELLNESEDDAPFASFLHI